MPPENVVKVPVVVTRPMRLVALALDVNQRFPSGPDAISFEVNTKAPGFGGVYE